MSIKSSARWCSNSGRGRGEASEGVSSATRNCPANRYFRYFPATAFPSDAKKVCVNHAVWLPVT
jgi:hypothetical protein